MCVCVCVRARVRRAQLQGMQLETAALAFFSYLNHYEEIDRHKFSKNVFTMTLHICFPGEQMCKVLFSGTRCGERFFF